MPRDNGKKCIDCNLVCDTQTKLQQHKCGTCRCPLCPFLGKSSRAVSAHQRVHKTTYFECTKCEYRNVNEISLRLHQRVHNAKETVVAANLPVKEETGQREASEVQQEPLANDPGQGLAQEHTEAAEVKQEPLDNDPGQGLAQEHTEASEAQQEPLANDPGPQRVHERCSYCHRKWDITTFKHDSSSK